MPTDLIDKNDHQPHCQEMVSRNAVTVTGTAKTEREKVRTKPKRHFRKPNLKNS